MTEFEPEHDQPTAGRGGCYNSAQFHDRYRSHDETLGKHLRVLAGVPDSPPTDAFTPPVALPPGSRFELRVEVDHERRLFALCVEGRDPAWQWLAQVFDASILSDEATVPGAPNFTGAFVGLACQDTAGTALPADFDWFEYRERPFLADPAQV